MKLVTAIIKPFKLDEVREALSAIGVTGITTSMPRKPHWSPRQPNKVCNTVERCE